MKTATSILFGFALSGLGCFSRAAQDAGSVQATHPFSITLTPDPVVVKSGKRILVNATIKNLQDHPLEVLGGFFPYGLSGLDGRYQWKCTDDAGRVVSKEIDPVGSVHDYLYLEPGKTREMNVELNRVCDLERPGKFTATLSLNTLRHPNDPVVSSNTIAIEVQ